MVVGPGMHQIGVMASEMIPASRVSKTVSNRVSSSIDRVRANSETVTSGLIAINCASKALIYVPKSLEIGCF